MNNKNKFQVGEKVILKDTGKTVTIKKSCYVRNMKRFSYTIEENPSMFFFEEEIKEI